jgi:hypothetical protein
MVRSFITGGVITLTLCTRQVLLLVTDVACTADRACVGEPKTMGRSSITGAMLSLTSRTCRCCCCPADRAFLGMPEMMVRSFITAGD